MICPQEEHKEFFSLFQRINRQEQRELLYILEDIAQYSRSDDTEQYRAYIDSSLSSFSLTGNEKTEEFEQFTEEEQINARVLMSFALLEDSYKRFIVNGLKGMVNNGVCRADQE